ncbi:MAG: SusC/RagA family TonB-linked outer membrane protein [Tenuifilaceae bacterium]
MKRLCVFLACLVLVGINLVQAQTVRITGTVTSSEDGMPIPGVSVVVKGTSTGITTNIDGKYELTVPATATTLTFSFVGMKTQDVEIGGRAVIDVVMESESLQVEEVVITSAYGIKRTPKGSAALSQVVTGEKLNEVRQTNVNNALAGKVSGIQVRSQSSAKLGSTGNIRLRGEGGFSTGQSVLYVVDGTIITNSNEINMDNVEDISVLSGPSASAILGPQGANGAIIVTTKKAKSTQRGVGIEVNTGIQASKVYIMPQYQNSYSGGGNANLIRYDYKPTDPTWWQSLDGKYFHDYSDDASWGPRMVGQEYIPWYAWYDGTKYTGQTAKLVGQPDNSRDFFETGFTKNSSIAFSKATESMNVRVVYGNIGVQGLIPGSELKKNSISVKSSFDLTKKFTVAANINFNSTKTQGEFDDGYSNQSTGSFNQWFHRDIDMKLMKELRGLKTADGIWASWNHNNPTSYNPANERMFYAGNYWYNFYTYFDLVSIPSRDDRLFGDISMNYKITNDLAAKFTYRRQTLSQWGEAYYSTDLAESGTQTQGNSPETKGFYRSYTQYTNRDNYESLISYSKSFSDLKVNANAGSDFFVYTNKYNNAQTVDGMSVANLYSISNSKSQPSITNNRFNEKSRAIFLRGDVSFKDFLFAEFTVRNDWFSVLPKDDNAILSKSFGASFVFSDILKLDFMNFGKVRFAWGEIPTAIGIYAYPGQEYSVNQYKWGSNFLMATPDGLVDPNIKGAKKTQKEIGVEVRFLESMVGLTATYWDGTETDIPYQVNIAGFSGYTSNYLNTGEISKKGLDLQLSLRPIANDSYRWDVNYTFSYLLDNKVVKIADGIDQFTVQSQWGGGTPDVVHTKGEQWGQLYGGGRKLFQAVDGSGNNIDHVNNGKPIITANGLYVNDPKTYYGNVLPKVTGGLQNSIRFMKDFNFSFNIDYQFGGKFFSLSDMWGTYSGLTARTAGLNDKGLPVRDAVADGGGVHVIGVDATGNDVDYYVDAQDYYHGMYNNDVYNDNVYDLSFVKLREVSLGYNLPVKKLGVGNWIQNATIAIVAQNPWLIYAKNKDYDPSEISNIGGETGQLPGVRTFGANLKISF